MSERNRCTKWIDIILNFLTERLTDSMEQSRTRIPSASQISDILWNPKFHYRLVPILSHINPLYGLLYCSFKMRFNMLSTLAFPEWSLSFGSPYQTRNKFIIMRHIAPYSLHCRLRLNEKNAVIYTLPVLLIFPIIDIIYGKFRTRFIEHWSPVEYQAVTCVHSLAYVKIWNLLPNLHHR